MDEKETKKLRLSEILEVGGRVKASAWLSEFDKMPGEEYASNEDIFKDTKTVTKKSDAADVSVSSPERIDVKVTVKALNSAADIISKQAAIDANKEKKVDLDEKSPRETREDGLRRKEMSTLVDSILSLTKVIQENAIKKIQEEELPRHKQAGSLKELFGNIASQKMESFREKTSMRGLLTMGGIGSAHRGTESIIDNVLGYFENKKETKKADAKARKEQQELTPSWGSAIVSGSKEYLGNKLQNALDASKDRLKQVGNNAASSSVGQKISGLKESIVNKSSSALNDLKSVVTSTNMGKKIHGIAGDIAQKAPKSIDDVRRIMAQGVFDINKSAKIKAIADPNSLLGTISRKKFPEIGKNPDLERARVINTPANKKERELAATYKESLEDELLKVNEDQLTQLKKIVDNAMAERADAAMAKKAEKENKLEASDENPKDITFSQEKKTEKEGGSLISKLTDMLTEGLGGYLTKMMMGPLMKFALPALGVAGAGALGVGAGTLLNNHIINPAAEKLTGVKGATLGTALYDGVDKIKGWFGNSDADKMKEAEEQAKKHLESRKNSTQKLDGVSYRLSEAPNIVTPTAAIPKVQNPLLNMVKRGEDINPTEARNNLAAPSVNSSLVKTPNVYRVSQMNQVRATIKETERVAESKKSGSGANSVIDARTNVTNNANTINHIRPNLVNPDMVFNKILQNNFSH